MPSYKLPLTADQQQEISDNASPYDIPALLDLVNSCQNVLLEIQNRAVEAMGCKEVLYPSGILALVDQVLPRKPN